MVKFLTCLESTKNCTVRIVMIVMKGEKLKVFFKWVLYPCFEHEIATKKKR